MILKLKQSKLLLYLLCSIIIISFVIFYWIVFLFSQNQILESDTSLSEGICNDNIAQKNNESTAVLKNKETFIFLAAGVDEVSGLADVILLASYNLKAQKLVVLQIPRDTYFNVSSATYKKINGAISELGGIENFAQKLESAFNIEIDHTLKFTLDAFAKLVDSIGGVSVVIPNDMDYDDPYQNLHIHLEKGEHLLNGDTAKQFVRFRSGYVRGDIDRTDAQKIFMAALVEKITTDVSIFQMSSLIDILLDDVETDMKFSDCLELSKQMISLKPENVVMLTACGSDTRTKIDSGAWYYIINRSATIEILNKYFVSFKLDENSFDVTKQFTNSKYPHFDEIYYSNEYKYFEYDAENINTEGIKIGRTD